MAASKKIPLVLYHGSCNDGFCAAYMAWRHFGDGADYLPVNHGQPPPDVTGRDVYILDFSYKRAVLLEMAKTTPYPIKVIDHHKTAQDELLGWQESTSCTNALRVVFDLNKSGGRLAQEYFQPEHESWLVDYTEDRDLWRFALPDSKELNAYIGIIDHKFEDWQQIDGRYCNFMVDHGYAILCYQQQAVDRQCRNARDIDLAGYTVPSLNATMLISEIGHKLCQGRPFSVTYFIRSDGVAVWSLRSDENGVDVSEIAKRFGGGGHKHAAGYQQVI